MHLHMNMLHTIFLRSRVFEAVKFIRLMYYHIVISKFVTVFIQKHVMYMMTRLM